MQTQYQLPPNTDFIPKIKCSTFHEMMKTCSQECSIYFTFLTDKEDMKDL